jgi:hypothetical protein
VREQYGMPGPTEPSVPLACSPVLRVDPDPQEPTLNAKSLIMTAGIALVVVLAFEQSKGKIPGLKISA